MGGRIPSDFIQQLLDRIDIVDIVDAVVPLRKSGANHFGSCPFHQEKTASFSVSQDKQFYHCFGCGVHGSAIGFLMEHDHLSFVEAVESLAQRAGLEVPRSHSRPQKKSAHDDIYDVMEKISQFYQKQLRKSPYVIEYLKNRGLSGEIAKQFKVGFAPPGWEAVLNEFGRDSKTKELLLQAGMLNKKEGNKLYDRFRERLMFPIRDRRGRIVGFGGRVLDKGEPKYLNSPETTIFQKRRELYGLYEALQANRKLNQIIIVEGYMDVIALAQYGVTFSVATLGTAVGGEHIQQLLRYTSKLIFCFDGDKAGRAAAWRALEVAMPLINDTVQVKFLFLADGEDPDTTIRQEGKDAFLDRLAQSKTLSNFFFSKLAENINLMDIDGRARYLKLAVGYVDRLSESAFRQMLIAELAQKIQMSIQEIQPYLTIEKSQQKMKVQSKSPSMVRSAIALLLQHPELIQYVEEPLPLVSILGFPLLVELIALLKESPGLNTAAIVEYWRDHPNAKILAKLAVLEHNVPNEGLELEFKGVLAQFEKVAREQKAEELLAKMRQKTITAEEKNILQNLLVEH